MIVAECTIVDRFMDGMIEEGGSEGCRTGSGDFNSHTQGKEASSR
jgi:hypothetical protein